MQSTILEEVGERVRVVGNDLRRGPAHRNANQSSAAAALTKDKQKTKTETDFFFVGDVTISIYSPPFYVTFCH